MPSSNTPPFTLLDPIFTKVSTLITQAEIDLINSSNLLRSLLHEFAGRGCELATGNGNAYTGNTLELSQNGTNFVRLLGHELGHFYDHQLKNDATALDLVDNFADIIKYEMDESQATAISYIIRKQIMLNGGPDIEISNRIGKFSPDGGEIAGGLNAEIVDLDGRFAGRVAGTMTAADSWALAQEIAQYIWGKNFLTRPRDITNRWQDRLDDAYGGDVPTFLQDSERKFQSAKIVNGQYQFLFKDKDGQLRAWVYEGTNGSNLAETDKRDLVTGKEAAGSSDTLHGGDGDDILYGGWTNDDSGNDALYGGAGNDTLVGGFGQDTLDGGADNDTFLVEGADQPDVFDVFIGGEGTDSIQGGDKDDTIRVESLLKETHSIEVIDGGGGANVLAGTDSANTIELLETEIRNIKRIELQGGQDTLRLSAQSIGGLAGVTLDGGDGEDSIEGTDEADNLDLRQLKLKDFEKVQLGAGNDTVQASSSADGPEEYYGGADNDTIDGKSAGRGLKLYGEGGRDKLYGGAGNDTLDGGADADILEGGAGFDSYSAGDGDTIKDSDGKGRVTFAGIALSGGEQEKEGSSTYKGSQGETYKWSGGSLKVSYAGSSLTIKGFSNDSLGIHLEKIEEPDPPPPPDPPRPAGGDPLVLDLGGNGIITVGLDAGIHFDHDGDGFRELSGFVNAEDGLLVLDRNEDGKINDGTELFGDNTRFFNGTIAPHGFAALSELDDNKDGVVDKNDAYFSKLRIFQDFNQNGQNDPGELFSLDEKKIVGLNLAYEDSPFVDKFGNLHRQIGTFVTESGEELTMTDVVFTMNRTLTTTEMLAVPEDIAALPDAKGYGTTYDLHQAMVRDTEGRLKALVEDFVTSTDRDSRLALTDQILFVWTGQSEGPVTERKQNDVLNSFFGTWVGNQWSLDPNRYEQQKDTTYYQLMRASHLDWFFANVTYALNPRTNTYVGAFDNVAPVLAAMLEQSPEQAYTLVQDITRAIRGINPYNRLNSESFQGAIAQWQENRDPEDVFSVATLAIMDSLAHGASDLNDLLQGGAGNDIFHGLNGNDTLIGASGDDILIGGAGNDVLNGGAGSDIYRFSRGDGKDRINNLDTSAGRIDTLELTGGIQASELVFVRSGDDLIIEIGGKNDVVRINSHFYQDSGGGYAVDQIRLDDDTIIQIGSSAFEAMHTLVTQVTEEADELHGTLGNDTMNGLGGNDSLFGKEGDDVLEGGVGNDLLEGDDGNDLLSGGDGNDTLYGGAGNDALTGGAGTDWLYGGEGDDTLAGGADSDYLTGGGGNNTYRYGLGDGWDTILYPKTAVSATDTLEFTNGLNSDDVAIRRWENDLVFLVADGGRLRVENYFLHSAAPISTIRFSNGTAWNSAKIADMVRIGTPQDDFLYGANDHDTLHGLEGNDSMRGYAGDDQLYGDEGNDSLSGDDGNDILEGGAGNDRLWGGTGNDTLIGGAGTDILEGGSGSDTYRFEAGFGQDVIYNSDSSSGRFDVIEFGSGISPAAVTAERSWNNLILRVEGSTDAITVSNYFLNIDEGGSSYIDAIRFADGTSWDVAAVKQRVIRITEGNDEIHGYAENDVFDGLGGNDSIFTVMRKMMFLTAWAAMIQCTALGATISFPEARAMMCSGVMLAMIPWTVAQEMTFCMVERATTCSGAAWAMTCSVETAVQIRIILSRALARIGFCLLPIQPMKCRP